MKKTILLLALCLGLNELKAQSSSILPNVMVVPTVSNFNQIPSPDLGMLVFKSPENKLFFYNGSIWAEVPSTSGSGLSLPFSESASSATSLFEVTNTNISSLDADGIVGKANGLGTGVVGHATLTNPTEATSGIKGVNFSENNRGSGVYAEHKGSGPAIYSTTENGYGIVANSFNNYGAFITSNNFPGAYIKSFENTGLIAVSESSVGLQARSEDSTSLRAVSVNGTGLFALSLKGNAAEFQSSSLALKTNGGIQFGGAQVTPDSGKFLMSVNNLGDAIWQTLNQNPQIGFFAGATGQSVPTGTITDLLFDTPEFNDGSGFSAASEVFTVPLDGMYDFNTQFYWNSANSGETVISIKVDGVPVYQSNFGPKINLETMQVSRKIKLIAGQVVHITIWQNSGASLTLGGTDNAAFFSGNKVY